MPETLTNLLVQIPLVGIFVWFILERDKRSDGQQSIRETQWRDFLREQREQNNAAIARLAEKIESISHEVSRSRAYFRRMTPPAKSVPSAGASSSHDIH